jgi:hypothetical protein
VKTPQRFCTAASCRSMLSKLRSLAALFDEITRRLENAGNAAST